MWRVVLVVLLAVYSITGQTDDASISITVERETEPYLLVSTRTKILRMNLNGENLTTLANDTSHQSGIIAVDYHYRLNLLFWATGTSIKYASLTDGSNQSQVGDHRTVRNLGGLAVDWINDKLYWADRKLKKIFVFDLHTKDTSIVTSLEESMNPKKLKIYPQFNSGWLYMASNSNILKIPLIGGSDPPEEVLNTQCVYSLALDYKGRNIYTLDGCNYQLISSKIDGSNDHVIKTNGNNLFPYGASLYKDDLFWTKGGAESLVTCFNITNSIENTVYTSIEHLSDIQVVHLSNQPSAAELEIFSACDQGCMNGNCDAPSGVCLCEEGWGGELCDEDVDECQGGTHCDQICVNTRGSFQCECETGFLLMSDQRTCMEATVAPPETTPTTSKPETTPTIGQRPTTPTTGKPETTPTTGNTESIGQRATTPTNGQSQTTPTPNQQETTPTNGQSQTTPTTNQQETTPTNGQSQTTPTTNQQETTPTNGQSQTTPTTNQQETTPTTDKQETTPTTDKQETTPTTSKPDTTPIIAKTTPNSGQDTASHGMTTVETPTLPPGVNGGDENGLKADGNEEGQNKLVIVGVVLAAVGFMIAAVVTVYLVVLFFKYKLGKTGSYDVYKRQSIPRRDRLQDHHGTSSVHSSFRDITQEYNDHHRDRILEDVAELGCAGEMNQVEEYMSTALRNVPPLENSNDRRDNFEAVVCDDPR